MKIFHYENETYGIDLIARNFITDVTIIQNPKLTKSDT